MNEAQYLLVNASSVLELQQQLNARLDPFPGDRRDMYNYLPLGGLVPTGEGKIWELVSSDPSVTGEK